jgi:hypothetical protein
MDVHGDWMKVFAWRSAVFSGGWNTTEPTRDRMFVKTQMCTDLVVHGNMQTSDLLEVSVGRCPRLPEMLRYMSIYLSIRSTGEGLSYFKCTTHA